MIYLIQSSFIIYLGYVIISIIKTKSSLENLSDTYYIWPKWVFPTFMTVIASILLPAWLEITEGHDLQFLAFLSCAGLIFVGFTPNYRNDKMQYKIHSICVYLIALTSVLSMLYLIGGIEHFIISLIVIFLTAWALGENFKECWLFKLETALFLGNYFSLINQVN